MEITLEKQLEHYTNKMEKVISNLKNGVQVRHIAKAQNFDLGVLREKAKEGSEEFKGLAYVFSRKEKGKEFFNFAAAVVSIARQYDLKYEVFAGYALDKESQNYEDAKASEEKNVTYVYVKVEGMEYHLKDTMDLIDIHKLDM